MKDHDKPKSRHSNTNSDRDTQTTLSGHDLEIPDVSSSSRERVVLHAHSPPVGPILPILQAVKRCYRRTVDYCAYRLANRSTRYHETMPIYTTYPKW